jgi:translocator protein
MYRLSHVNSLTEIAMIDYLPLGVFLAVTAAAAMSGGFFGPGPWYLTLKKPWWTPPGWAFPLVWTVLYVMIAVAGAKVWQMQGMGLLIVIWAVQLILNAAWSYIMFGRKQIGWALVDAGGMWIAIAAFSILAWPVNQTASLLFMPYLLWVTIAFALNLRILQMNPSA